MEQYAKDGLDTTQKQLKAVVAWGVANTGSLAQCNDDKRKLREWVEKQRLIYKK